MSIFHPKREFSDEIQVRPVLFSSIIAIEMTAFDMYLLTTLGYRLIFQIISHQLTQPVNSVLTLANRSALLLGQEVHRERSTVSFAQPDTTTPGVQVRTTSDYALLLIKCMRPD